MRAFRFIISEEFLRSALHMPPTSEIFAVAPVNHVGTDRPMDFMVFATDTAVPYALPDEEGDSSSSGLSTLVVPVLHKEVREEIITWDWNIKEE